jgi:20S proteasome subunit alpha 1
MKKRGNWDLATNEAVKLAILTLQTVIGQEFKNSDIEIGLVTKEQPLFCKLPPQKIDEYLNEVSKKD